MSDREGPDPTIVPASFPRQDATGLDLPPGKSADELDSDSYRPATVTEGVPATGRDAAGHHTTAEQEPASARDDTTTSD